MSFSSLLFYIVIALICSNLFIVSFLMSFLILPDMVMLFVILFFTTLKFGQKNERLLSKREKWITIISAAGFNVLAYIGYLSLVVRFEDMLESWFIKHAIWLFVLGILTAWIAVSFSQNHLKKSHFLKHPY